MAERKCKVWMNGRMIAPEEATVSVFGQTGMRGANLYEGLRCYWDDAAGRLNVCTLDDHLDRLFQGMRIMRMAPPFTRKALRQGAIHWARANEFRQDVHFRLVACLGDDGSGGVKAFRPGEIDLGAVIFGGPRRHDSALEKGLHVQVCSWRRIADDVMPPRVKAGANHQDNRLAAIQARTDGYDDALMLNRDGTLPEATGAAVMMVRDGELVTSPVTADVLASMTRRFILGLQESRGNCPPVH